MSCELVIKIRAPRSCKKRNRIQWAIRKMLTGKCVARHSWRLDSNEPRYLFVKEGSLYAQMIGTQEPILCKTIDWKDARAKDWHVVEQLELCR